MDDELSDERIESLVEQGNNNAQTEKKVRNWCRNARYERSGGLGMIEAVYNTPIGHAGVRCDHAPMSGSFSWDWEDAFLRHYLANCRGCKERIKGTGPNIQSVIDEYEEKEKARKQERERIAYDEQIARRDRQSRLSQILDATDPIDIQLLEIFEDIEDGVEDAKIRLTALAKLNHDAFSDELLSFMLTALTINTRDFGRAISDSLTYLLRDETDKRALLDFVKTEVFNLHIANFVSENANVVPNADVEDIAERLFYFREKNPADFGESIVINRDQLLHFCEVKRSQIMKMIKRHFDGNNIWRIWFSIELLQPLAIGDKSYLEPFLRDVIGKYLRFDQLFPQVQERGKILGAFRELVYLCYFIFHTDSQDLIDKIVEGAPKKALFELETFYVRVLRIERNAFRSNFTPVHEKAFTNLIWLSVKNIQEIDHSPGAYLFDSYSRELAPIASKYVDQLMGAAIQLSSIDNVDEKNIFELDKLPTLKLEEQSKKLKQAELQKNLIHCAFIGAVKSGILAKEQLLNLSNKVLESDEQFHENFIKSISTLVSDTDSLNLLLPYFYKSLTHVSPVIRGAGILAISKCTYSDVRDFPDLIFELVLIQLSDPVIYVHQTVIQKLKPYMFPNHFLDEYKQKLELLIVAYHLQKGHDDFLASAIITYVESFLSKQELASEKGESILFYVQNLETFAKKRIIQFLPYYLKSIKGANKFLISELLSHSQISPHLDDHYRALFALNINNLKEIKDELVHAGASLGKLKPYEADNIIELLSISSEFKAIVDLCEILEGQIEDTKENELTIARIRSIKIIADFELSVLNGTANVEHTVSRWEFHLNKLKNLLRAKNARPRIPPFLLR